MGPGKVFNLIAQYLNEVGIGTLASLNVTGATITGTLSTKVPLSAVTSGVGSETVLTNGQTGHLITNTGASAKASCKLPASPAAGTFYDFLCDDADGFRVVANTGQTISLGGLGTSASAGYVETVRQFSAFRLTYTATNTWVGTRVEGTWRKDSTSSAGFSFTPWEFTATMTHSWDADADVSESSLNCRVIGRELTMWGRISFAGAGPNTLLTVTLPNSWQVASSTDGITGHPLTYGLVSAYDQGVGNQGHLHAALTSSDRTTFFVQSGTTTQVSTSASSPITWANGDEIHFRVHFPVQ